MRKFWLLILIVYALLFLGLASMKGALLGLAIPLVVYLAAGQVTRPGELNLRVVRKLGAEREAGSVPVPVELFVTNAGSRVEEILVQDLLPDEGIKVDGQTQMFTTLPPGGDLSLRYSVAMQRGILNFTGVRVTTGDASGLSQKDTFLPAPGCLTVKLDARKLRPISIRPFRTRLYAGPIPARIGGPGVTIFRVREYQPGDPRRWINWKISARRSPQLYINEFEQDRIADVGLILDARLARDVRVADETLFEHAVRATASLAEAFLHEGHRVSLLVYGWDLAWTFPGYGKLQIERIRRVLAGVRTVGSMRLDFLPVRLFSPRSQIVLISSLGEADLKMLVRLRGQGFDVFVVSPDPVDFEARLFQDRPMAPTAARIAHLERALLLSKIRQAGVTVLDWQVHNSLERAISGVRIAGPGMVRKAPGKVS